jgi:SET domain
VPFQFGSWHSPKLVLRRISARERGVFAIKPVDPGEILTISGGLIVPYRRVRVLPPSLRRFAFFVENDFYVVPSNPRRVALGFYMNHSCDPNAGGDNDWAVTSVAIRPITPDEEVTCDYRAELVPRDPRCVPFRSFQCHCGASGCTGLIRY